ncbi:hypothetical protein ACFXG6_31765 [Streptomyces roseus]|uniref:hypothetical protein n=1 Tax=Streptomyces roseus TaxID=66430 RepID=UPI0036BC2954
MLEAIAQVVRCFGEFISIEEDPDGAASNQSWWPQLASAPLELRLTSAGLATDPSGGQDESLAQASAGPGRTFDA